MVSHLPSSLLIINPHLLCWSSEPLQASSSTIAISRTSSIPPPAILHLCQYLWCWIYMSWELEASPGQSFWCPMCLHCHPNFHFDHQLLCLNFSLFLTAPTFALFLPGPFILVIYLFPALYSVFNPVAQSSLSRCQPHTTPSSYPL